MSGQDSKCSIALRCGRPQGHQGSQSDCHTVFKKEDRDAFLSATLLNTYLSTYYVPVTIITT